jgi:predicted transcriptional regulator of viral defense system
MTRTITELGPKQAEFLATMAGSGRDVFDIEAARHFWTTEQVMRNDLAELERKGWLERLERGRYLIIPLEAGVEREWSADPLAIGSFLAPDGAAAYWTAIRYWGWTTQLPRTQLLITPSRRFRAETTVLGVRYRFVTLKAERVFGIREERLGDLAVRVTDPERTVVDALDRTDLAGGVGEVAEALRQAWGGLDVERLTRYMERFGSGTVPKRLGYLVENLGLPVDPGVIDDWRSMIGSGITSLERGGPKTGRMTRAWNLQVNVGETELGAGS